MIRLTKPTQSTLNYKALSTAASNYESRKVPENVTRSP